MNRNVRLLELYNICMSALFIMPVLIPYYRDEIDLTFQHFLIGEAIFAGVIVILEVPSGWLSDIWKRKHVLSLSCVFWILGFGSFLFANSFEQTIVAQVFLGIAVSLFSGTASALLYDSLLAENREAEYSRLEGRRFGVGLYSLAIASIIGGFMYAIDPSVPMIASMLIGFPAMVCTLRLIEPPRHKSAVQGHPLKDMAITLNYALRGHAEIGFIIIFAGMLFAGTKLIMWSQQPYYMALTLPEQYYGLLMAVGYILGGFSSQMAHRFDGRVSNLGTLSLCLSIALFICLICAASVALHGVVLLMFGASCLYGIASPRVSDAINQRVDSSRRATILSTVNLLREMFFIPSSIAVGYVYARGGIGDGLYVIAGWLTLAGIFILLWAAKRRRASSLVQP